MVKSQAPHPWAHEQFTHEELEQGWATPGTRTKHGTPVTSAGTRNPLL